jgi:hypothetical protein
VTWLLLRQALQMQRESTHSAHGWSDSAPLTLMTMDTLNDPA